MTVLTRKTAEWADKPNTLTVMVGDADNVHPRTAAFAFVFSQDKVLGVEVRKRGWDIPGGHIEVGESSLSAVVRETTEEAGLTLPESAFTVCGWTHLFVEAEKPDNYKYPYPHTYQIVYTAHVDVPFPLTTNVPDEIDRVEWLSHPDAQDRFSHTDWWPLLKQVWGQ